MKRFIACLALTFLLFGCVSVGHKIDQSAVAKIEKGKTTKAEVINLLGSPDQITMTANGDTTFMYMFSRATAKPATFIPIVGAFAGGANVQNQMFMVSFGPDGIVKNFISSQGGTESDRGVTAAGKADLPDVEQNKRPK